MINELFELKDEKYKEFQSKLIPNIDKNSLIGVRTPELRVLAKTLIKEKRAEDFLNELPHRYFDENQLHAFIISEIKDFDTCIEQVCKFLPFVDNWATCDQLSPKCFKKNREKLLPYIYKWISSNETYTVRFAIGMLMQHFLDDDYNDEYPKLVCSIVSDEYYVKMMAAWYFATALAKQYDSILPFFKEQTLDKWTHNKSIQKAIESRRITDEQKDVLRALKK